MDVVRSFLCLALLPIAILSMAAGCPPVDECPSDPNKTAQGVCGCGTPDDDVDGDGLPACGPAEAVDDVAQVAILTGEGIF